MSLRAQYFGPPNDSLRSLPVVWVDANPDVIVWNAATPRPGTQHTLACPCVAFLDVREDDYGVVHPQAMDLVEVQADAYAGDLRGLESAFGWLVQRAPMPDRGAVFLGTLGTAFNRVAIGTAVAIAPRCVIGRSTSCDLSVRHGAHSDQNVCAPKHAILERSAEGVTLTDLESTNGTFLNGQRITGPARVPPRSEIAFATFRLRFVG